MKNPRRPHQTLTRSDVKQQLDALVTWRGTVEIEPTALYVVGSDKPLTDAERLDLIARVRAGEVIQLELDAIPFLQRETANRNAIRFTPGMLASFARSFKGAPFLRNHDQDDQAQRGGTILASKMERLEDGTVQFRMRLKLVKPWAVESALDGTLDRFSIGWHRDRTKPMECSTCKADWLLCAHWPGMLDEKGAVVQLVISAAEGTEVSAVNVPAVVGTFIESISQLKTIDPAQLADILAADTTYGEPDDMKLLAAVIAALALPTTTTEDEAVAAVERTRDELASTKDKLTIATSTAADTKQRLTALEAEAEERKKLATKATIDGGIAQLLAAGKIKPGSETEAALRRTGERSLDVFSATVTDMLATGATVTPVGAPLPAANPDPAPAAPTTSQAYLASKPETAKWLAKAGISEEQFSKHGETGREIAGAVFTG